MATQTKTDAKPRNAKPRNDGEQPERDNNQVLTLDTLAPERPYTVIDDERHDYRLLQDFGLRERQEFDRISADYDRLWAKGQDKPLSKTDQGVIEQRLDWLLDHVLVDAKKLREQLQSDSPVTGEPRLTGAIKREIVLAFTNAPVLIALAQQIKDQSREDSSTTES